MVQLNLDQPPGEQFGGREWRRVQHPYPDLPGVAGQLPGNCPQGHRRVGQVSYQIFGRHSGASLDVGFPRLHAGVSGSVLSGPGSDQQVPHGVGASGHVRQDMRPGPLGQQRRSPQISVGNNAGIVKQPLRRLVDLAVQLELGRVHQPTLSQRV